jgi:methionyl-tRNA formyltransferase
MKGKSSSLKNKIVFFGTPIFAAEILRFLIQHRVSVVGVVTQPDRPRGRALQLSPSPVKEVAEELAPGVPILQPEKASEEGFLRQLASLNADLFAVVVYGQILSQRLLSIPPLGCINVHPSLLPKYRGAAPIHRCLMAGDAETGVSIQKIVRELDAGDVIAVEKTSIPPDMTFGELEEKLLEISKRLLLEVIQSYEKGIPPMRPQNHSLATYASKFDSDEGEIHWGQPSQKIHNLVRAFSPRPGAWCWIDQGKKRIKILRTRMAAGQGNPGELLSATGVIACGDGALQLIEVQPEGKKIMTAAEWLRGMPHFKKFI